MDDDQVLLKRLRSGDERAFELLVDRYDGGLRRVARTFVNAGSAVDDVVQETWLGVLRGLHAFEGRSSLRTWMFSILINQARTRARRDARSLPFSALETDDGPTVDPGPSGTMAAGRARRRDSTATRRPACSAASCARSCCAPSRRSRTSSAP